MDELLLILHVESNEREDICFTVSEMGYSFLHLTEEVAKEVLAKLDCSCQESSRHRIARYREVK